MTPSQVWRKGLMVICPECEHAFRLSAVVAKRRERWVVVGVDLTGWHGTDCRECGRSVPTMPDLHGRL